MEISAIMWKIEGIWVIRVKPPFLQNLVPIKMFANSHAVLNKKILERAGHVNYFQTELSGFLVLDRQETGLVFFLCKKGPVAQTRLMMSRIDHKFTFYSKPFCSK